jgi:hypothetical protein
MEVPAAGLVALTDPETGALRVVDTSRPEVRRELAGATLREARDAFRRARVDALALSTAEPYDRPLAAFFEAREKRR